MCYEQKLARARIQLHAFVRSCKWFFVLSWSLTFPDFYPAAQDLPPFGLIEVHFPKKRI